MMRALVTGGAGFIGSHLCDFLLELGWAVDVVDDLSTGSRSNLPAEYRGTFYEKSANDPILIDSLARRADAIFHLAAIVGVHRVIERPLQTIQSNTEATAVVLHAASQYGVPTVIASSSEVYGRSIHPLLSETADMQIGQNIRWGYSAAKVLDEFTAMAHYNETGLPVVICRLFNTIGPRQVGRYGMVVPRFIDQAVSGQPITVYGDGTQRRSFTWVGDVARALFQLAITPAAHGQIVNIGHPTSMPIVGLANLVRKMVGSSSTIVHVDRAEAYGLDFDDIEHRVADLTKIRELIHYQPTLELDDMLRQILQSKTERPEC